MTPPAPSVLSAPSAVVAREALSRALTDAPGEVRVSWWEDGLTAARDVHPNDVGPHWRGTLDALAQLLSAERSVTAAKGSGRALCGAAVRQCADGWRRRKRTLDGWALAHLDLDPPAAGAMRGEGVGPSVASVAAGLRALGIAAIVHPSPSARVGGGASTRVRAWVVVAEAGGPVRGDASALAHVGKALAVALGAALGGLVQAGQQPRQHHPGMSNHTLPAPGDLQPIRPSQRHVWHRRSPNNTSSGTLHHKGAPILGRLQASTTRILPSRSTFHDSTGRPETNPREYSRSTAPSSTASTYQAQTRRLPS